ncbi:hypothetical protein, partial [Devosia sp.]|uniref:hypothetical protein n=1 Tax=Devosia sp. TaxID=1871048 RepID=UPI0037C15ED1
LGMHLRTPADEVIVWFNRRIDTVLAKLPPGNWDVALVSDAEVKPLAEGWVVDLPPRSVVALTRATIPTQQPQEVPVQQPQETPVQNPPETQPIEPDRLPGNSPEELPDQPPGEGTPKE